MNRIILDRFYRNFLGVLRLIFSWTRIFFIGPPSWIDFYEMYYDVACLDLQSTS